MSVWRERVLNGPPVADSQIILMAADGDLDGVREGLRINARNHRAVATGQHDAVGAVLEDAARFAESDAIDGLTPWPLPTMRPLRG